MTTRYWLGRDGKRLGPYEEAEILEGVETGTVQATDLLWVEGMRRGIPVWEVLAQLGATGPTLPAHGRARPTRVRPGARSVDADIGLESIRYAGFWVRLGALVLDGLVMVVAVAVVAILGGAMAFLLGVRPSEVRAGFGAGLGAAVAMAVGWLYFAFLESSPGGATFGKRAFRLQVLTADRQRRISFLRASGRWVARWLSAAILLIGYLVQPFTPRRQALHDLLAGTVVIARAPAPRRLLGVMLALGAVAAAALAAVTLLP